MGDLLDLEFLVLNPDLKLILAAAESIDLALYIVSASFRNSAATISIPAYALAPLGGLTSSADDLHSAGGAAR